MTKICFVVDCTGKQLSPCSENKAGFLIRKGRARLISKYPMTIQLLKEVSDENRDKSDFVLGIDNGSKHVGVAVVQECINRNKLVFKGTIELRNDVSKKIEIRSGQRRYRRSHKRYRPMRFNNRASSRTEGRLAPSIKQKKDSVLRVVKFLNKIVPINQIVLEDVQIDIRKLNSPEIQGKEYQKSNRLDENLRMATLMRDCYSCRECGVKNVRLEAHHIVPRRCGGNNSINNLITLCSNCHKNVTNQEDKFIEKFQSLIGGSNLNFKSAQHVMQGKNYLRKSLSEVASLELTLGNETANRRLSYSITKSHSNDACVIAGLTSNTDIVIDFKIKPQKRKIKALTKEVLGFRHRDFVRYTKKKGGYYDGFITAIYPEKKQFNMLLSDGSELKRYGLKPVKLLWRFGNIRLTT